MWQWLVIVPVVLASAVYAAWAVVTPGTRLRFARWLARRCSGGPALLSRLAARLERAALPAGGCGACPASRVAPTDGRKQQGR